VALAFLAVWLGSPSAAHADPAPSATGNGAGLSVTDLTTSDGQLRFTLTARSLPPGTTLSADAITVTAGGRPLDTSARTEPTATVKPGAVVLALDTSGSMAGARLTQARIAAANYATGLPADVSLGLVQITTHPVTLAAPSVDRSRFLSAIAGTRAGGDTALFDAVRQAASLLSAPAYGERRVVLVTDGLDTASTTTVAAAASSLAAAHVTLDVVALSPTATGPVISALARNSGGRVVSASSAASLRTAFASIARPAEHATVTVTVPPSLAGRQSQLTVTVSSPQGVLGSVTVNVTFAGTASATAGPPAWLLYAALAAVFTGLLVAALVGVYAFTGRYRMRRRVRQVDALGTSYVEPDIREGSPVLRVALSAAQHAINERNRQGMLQDQLDRAGIAMRPAEWLLLRLGIAAAGGVLLVLLLPWWLGLPLGVLLGWFGGYLYRRMRATRRRNRFADALPESLQLVVSGLRSGFSFQQAVEGLARESAEPVSTEFGRAIAETRLGGDLEDALLRVAARTGSQDLSWLVMAIRIQREVGGNLSEVLETAVETMRERGRLNRHIRALSAEGRLSAWVLLALPVGLAGFMFLFRREYLRPLYSTALGIIMIAMTVVLIAVGGFWMSRVVKVEV
jgi:tight adherence protein B